jgi:tubulin monoglycylase TTLL3/8
VRRGLKRRGWHENLTQTSTAFHLRWVFSDAESVYKTLKPGQLFNHFPNNRELTTKSGLCKRMRAVDTYGVNVDTFFPRCFDIGEQAQLEEFVQEYERIELINVVVRHAKLFKSEDLEVANGVVNINCVYWASVWCIYLVKDLLDR